MVAQKQESTTKIRVRKKAADAVKKESAGVKTETWAKAIFHYPEIPGATWSARPNLKPEKFADGETYERPLALFQLLNENCRVVKRKLVKHSADSMGVYTKTKNYEPRLYFEILERFEKEV